MNEIPVIVVSSDNKEVVENIGRKSGMHPGVINRMRVHPKVNTCKPYKSGKGKLGKKMKRLSDRRNAHSFTLKTIGTTNPLAFKTPGSMTK